MSEIHEKLRELLNNDKPLNVKFIRLGAKGTDLKNVKLTILFIWDLVQMKCCLIALRKTKMLYEANLLA